MRVDRIWEFLQRLSPLTRSCLLTELERLETCGVDMPGTADLQARLRAELRPDGPNEAPTPSKYFFAPLEPLVVAGAPEHANTGRIARSSLVPIWEWINRDLLPIMARDYEDQMKGFIASNRPTRRAAGGIDLPDQGRKIAGGKPGFGRWRRAGTHQACGLHGFAVGL